LVCDRAEMSRLNIHAQYWQPSNGTF
jgi:hypothetical protein